MSTVHICSFSDQIAYKIHLNGKEYLFDFSDRFGPLVEGKRGQEVAQPGSRHLFWKAVSEWKRQGKRVCRCGYCIWRPANICGALDSIYYNLDGRNCLDLGVKILQADRCCPPLSQGAQSGDPASVEVDGGSKDGAQ